METKILLRLIKDDLLHLQGITDAFSMESLPGADEVELSLVRAKAILRQLELLHKSILQTNQLIIKEVTDQSKCAISEVVTYEDELVTKVSEPVSNPVTVPEAEAPKPGFSVVPNTPLIVQPENTQKESVPESQVSKTDAVELKHSLNTDQDESLGESEKSVNDIFTQEKRETTYQIIPIRSIWDGIGINDRFLLVRELFGNDSTLFEQTINTLDHFASIQEAVNYLKLNFKWQKGEASQKFLNLVKRRFTN